MAIIAMIIQLTPGAELPSYVRERAKIGGGIYTVDIEESDVKLLTTDFAVKSFENAKPLKQPTKTLYEPNAVEHIKTLNVDYAMEILFNEGTHHGWWKLPYRSIEEFKAGDEIGYDEFGGLVERILLASVQEKG